MLPNIGQVWHMLANSWPIGAISGQLLAKCAPNYPFLVTCWPTFAKLGQQLASFGWSNTSSIWTNLGQIVSIWQIPTNIDRSRMIWAKCRPIWAHVSDLGQCSSDLGKIGHIQSNLANLSQT